MARVLSIKFLSISADAEHLPHAPLINRLHDNILTGLRCPFFYSLVFGASADQINWTNVLSNVTLWHWKQPHNRTHPKRHEADRNPDGGVQ